MNKTTIIILFIFLLFAIILFCLYLYLKNKKKKNIALLIDKLTTEKNLIISATLKTEYLKQLN